MFYDMGTAFLKDTSAVKGLTVGVSILVIGLGALAIGAKVAAISVGGQTLAMLGLAGSLKAVTLAMISRLSRKCRSMRMPEFFHLASVRQ